MKCAPVFLVSVFLLSACGGGGVGSLQTPMDPGTPDEMLQPPGQPSDQGREAPSGSGGPGPVPVRSGKQPGLSARGVTVAIGHSGGLPTFAVNRGGTAWTLDGFTYFPGGGDNGDWTGTATKLNVKKPEEPEELEAAKAKATQRFRVVTDIAGSNDMDYLAYGYWSRHPSTSLYHDDFEPFYYGSMPWAGDVKNLSGQATYKGNAIGAYEVTRSLGSLITYGYFEAQVLLTASFGPNGQVEGRMTNIEDLEERYPDGNSPLSSFRDPSPFIADYDSSGRSFTNRDCGTSGCDWGGYFLGPSASGQVPTGTAGWFEGLSMSEPCTPVLCRTATLEGAFGAQRQ